MRDVPVQEGRSLICRCWDTLTYSTCLYIQLFGFPVSLVARGYHTSAVWRKAGHYKITPTRDQPLTYEQAHPPYRIGVTKGWTSWNASMSSARIHTCMQTYSPLLPYDRCTVSSVKRFEPLELGWPNNRLLVYRPMYTCMQPHLCNSISSQDALCHCSDVHFNWL